ncbi:hypothetical protein O181_015363 [Austropuccinia psidii MF-1]|uniref:CFEM domain-containing protein n=1 Tax=Austropuccinia psidii MF-1 TaxID=1389203 RepID=A0A9Q3C335_9BASI|nr:hypothetical protein [Austropuccinia psidii MF-1]
MRNVVPSPKPNGATRGRSLSSRDRDRPLYKRVLSVPYTYSTHWGHTGTPYTAHIAYSFVRGATKKLFFDGLFIETSGEGGIAYIWQLGFVACFIMPYPTFVAAILLGFGAAQALSNALQPRQLDGAMASLPACFSTCGATALANIKGKCEATDFACLCKLSEFLPQSMSCVAKECHKEDINKGLDTYKKTCGALGVNVTANIDFSHTSNGSAEHNMSSQSFSTSFSTANNSSAPQLKTEANSTSPIANNTASINANTPISTSGNNLTNAGHNAANGAAASHATLVFPSCWLVSMASLIALLI